MFFKIQSDEFWEWKQQKEFLEKLGYEVLRFKNEEIINELDKVLHQIRSFVNVLEAPLPQGKSSKA